MDGVTFRPATSADVPEFARIDRACDLQFVAAGHPEFGVEDPISADVAARAITEGRIRVAAEGGNDGSVVGWIFRGTCGDEWSVGQLSVDPVAQRRGIGSSLLLWALDEARSAGRSTIVLSTQNDIEWNQPWYERFGFAVVPRGEWTPAMHEVTNDQTAGGLDWATRVHMRLVLRRVSMSG